MAFPSDLLDFKHEETFYDAETKTLYGRTYIDWDGAYAEPEYPLPLDGVFKELLKTKFLLRHDKEAPPLLINKSFTQFSLTGDKSMESFFAKLANKKEMAVKTTSKGLMLYLLFAFLGGLILNLMPCVLPVISLKLFGLISHRDESKSKVLKHNLAYTAGILASFWALGAVILLLKSSGEKIGWGFQLQSPLFVLIMMIMIFVMALNMLGLFEFITPGGRNLGNKEIKEGFLGDFSSGVLATVLSTPCSAPFLGTALTFAFTASSVYIFLVFTFIGLGLAFPFILTGLFPKSVAFLPKPGAWMEKLKNLLGLSLLLTFIWLYDVLSALVDMQMSGLYFNTFFVSVFFAFYFRKKISKIFAWNALFFTIPVFLLTYVVSKDYLDIAPNQSEVRADGELYWEKWSNEAMENHKTNGQWVFIDFTATWCLTCKVNKKLVLNTESFAKLTEEHDLKLLVGRLDPQR